MRRAAVTSVRRDVDGRGALEVTAAALPPERFDRVILACQADEALRLLADATPLEREVLGAIPFQENVATLHTDASVMPASRRAWASWNAWVPPEPVLVSLNMDDRIAPERVLRRLRYAHPVYTPGSVRAQRRHGEIDGVRGTHFCGAYWSYGFHEDGVQSALRVCRAFGKDL